ncbi:hypothetical protein B0H34DRAFT_524163 [Crassisporium funariophilum]|nr:hypothetical protein B0H34DRAFT_524163 [Crassisporium funariophilum]
MPDILPLWTLRCETLGSQVDSCIYDPLLHNSSFFNELVDPPDLRTLQPSGHCHEFIIMGTTGNHILIRSASHGEQNLRNKASRSLHTSQLWPTAQTTPYQVVPIAFCSMYSFSWKRVTRFASKDQSTPLRKTNLRRCRFHEKQQPLSFPGVLSRYNHHMAPPSIDRYRCRRQAAGI